MIKRKVHQAFVEEVGENGYGAWHAFCAVTMERGFGACKEFNQPGESVIDRAVEYLNDDCRAEHVL